MDGQKTSNFSSKLPSFDKKNTHSLFIIGIAVLLVGGYGVAQSSQGYDVEIGQNGIKMYSGTLDVQGNDIVSAGTTVFNAGTGQIPTSIIDYSAATASDVGLGNADNADELDLDGSESMNGVLDVGSNDVTNVEVISNSNTVQPSSAVFGSGETGLYGDDSAVKIGADQEIRLHSDTDENNGGVYECVLRETDGVFECPQGKSWVHQMNNTHEAVYNSQESAKMRAVFEGSVQVDSKKNVSLPNHFSQTVSDTKPMLRAVATPDELATVAVTEKTSEYIIIESTESVGVDFRVTGVRDGFEDKQVVREKDE